MNQRIFFKMQVSPSSSRFGKGQGLVEYAINLALVAIVMIAVVQLLGPKVGNTLSTINNSLDTGGGAPGPWIYAIGEYNDFNLPPGTYEVQYGANGVHVTHFLRDRLSSVAIIPHLVTHLSVLSKAVPVAV